MRLATPGSMRRRALALGMLFGAGLPCAAVAQEAPDATERVPRARLLRIPSDSVANMVGGRVVDFDTGRPIVGALVYLRGTAAGVLTDHAGAFRLDWSGPGPREIGVRLTGYLGGCFNVTLSPAEMQSLLIAIPRITRPDPPRTTPGCADPEDVTPPSDPASGTDGRL